MHARPATQTDVPELVRLRDVMIRSVKGDSDASWQATCAALLEDGIAAGALAAVVVDSPEGGLAACGVGLIAQRLPSPGCPDGRYGYIQSMCTDDGHRRQGLARLVFEALMAWFVERGVTRVDLHASSMGEPLYRSYGFTDPVEPELRWRAPER